MGYIYRNYEFKSKENANEFKNFIANVDINIREYYRNFFVLNKLLVIFKKVYKITPIALRTEVDSRTKHLRKLAIYLLSKYSKASVDEISDYFNVSTKFINSIIMDVSFEKIHEAEINLFFKHLKDGYICNEYQRICFKDDVLDELSKLYEDVKL